MVVLKVFGELKLVPWVETLTFTGLKSWMD
jgi:hypothetical protein